MENRIQKAQAAQKPATQKPLDMLKSVLASDKIRQRLAETMNENAGAFSSSIIELFTSDGKLMQCDPVEVVQEALKGASLKLPINKQLGFAYVVPYKDKDRLRPQFQMGYKGYIQLAIRSGLYKHINSGAVYEGELVQTDKLTGEIDLTGERTSDEVVGYFAYIELLNGFSKTLYMTYDQMVNHAKRFSKSTYQGKLGGAWATDFDAMAQKTCLRLLVGKYGIMSVDMQQAFTADAEPDTIETTSEPLDITADIPDVEENDAPGEDDEKEDK